MSRVQRCPSLLLMFLLLGFLLFLSGRSVRERERARDPSGVRGSEPNPPGDQTAEPAAGHDPGRAAPLRLRHHRGGLQALGAGAVGAGRTGSRTLLGLKRNMNEIYRRVLRTGELNV